MQHNLRDEWPLAWDSLKLYYSMHSIICYGVMVRLTQQQENCPIQQSKRRYPDLGLSGLVLMGNWTRDCMIPWLSMGANPVYLNTQYSCTNCHNWRTKVIYSSQGKNSMSSRGTISVTIEEATNWWEWPQRLKGDMVLLHNSVLGLESPTY